MPDGLATIDDWGAHDRAGKKAAVAHPTSAPLIAMGLLNTLSDAKEENDLPRRDALLQNLRDLAVPYPDDAAIRERLAKGLFNTLKTEYEARAVYLSGFCGHHAAQTV